MKSLQLRPKTSFLELFGESSERSRRTTLSTTKQKFWLRNSSSLLKWVIGEKQQWSSHSQRVPPRKSGSPQRQAVQRQHVEEFKAVVCRPSWARLAQSSIGSIEGMFYVLFMLSPTLPGVREAPGRILINLPLENGRNTSFGNERKKS
ncbi:hypothetical protein RUM44_009771 [Polyplax serrata]|uniref:Uncharacterized protein n=1 Tax=Polyplax serrata TaxID=468196 RepID=A0ABR1ATM6_POLSC